MNEMKKILARFSPQAKPGNWLPHFEIVVLGSTQEAQPNQNTVGFIVGDNQWMMGVNELMEMSKQAGMTKMTGFVPARW